MHSIRDILIQSFMLSVRDILYIIKGSVYIQTIYLRPIDGFEGEKPDVETAKSSTKLSYSSRFRSDKRFIF